VALGATAVTGLLGPDPDRRMGSSRGNFFEFAGTPVMVTYHPSYLLRNNTNAAKRVVWEDLMKVMERVGMPISEKQRKFFT
jgi:DNA polymerase